MPGSLVNSAPATEPLNGVHHGGVSRKTRKAFGSSYLPDDRWHGYRSDGGKSVQHLSHGRRCHSRAFHCLDLFRSEYVENALKDEVGELTKLEQEVIDSLREQETLTENINLAFEKSVTFGQRVADQVATFGGILFLLREVSSFRSRRGSLV